MGKLITPAFLTDDQKGSPLGRIAARARRVVELVAERINAGRSKECRIETPTIPTESDFYELMREEVEWVTLSAEVDLAGSYSAAHKNVLTHKLNQKEWDIAKRDMPE